MTTRSTHAKSSGSAPKDAGEPSRPDDLIQVIIAKPPLAHEGANLGVREVRPFLELLIQRPCLDA
jgi:hypothetical protein